MQYLFLDHGGNDSADRVCYSEVRISFSDNRDLCMREGGGSQGRRIYPDGLAIIFYRRRHAPELRKRNATPLRVSVNPLRAFGSLAPPVFRLHTPNRKRPIANRKPLAADRFSRDQFINQRFRVVHLVKRLDDPCCINSHRSALLVAVGEITC